MRFLGRLSGTLLLGKHVAIDGLVRRLLRPCITFIQRFAQHDVEDMPPVIAIGDVHPVENRFSEKVLRRRSHDLYVTKSGLRNFRGILKRLV